MPRKLTGFINENDCIGDSLGTPNTTDTSTINGNSLVLDEALQALSGGTVNNFVAGGTLTVNSSAYFNNTAFANTNLIVSNTLSASTIIVREQMYVQPAYIETGGFISTITVNGISYRVHRFLSGTTNITINRPGEIEYLMVGGGGGGGMDMGGGGGGGGVLLDKFWFSAPTTTTVTIGSGGAGAPAGGELGQPGGTTPKTIPAQNGGNTLFLGLIAFGGGGGGTSTGSATAPRAGSNGASGGGTSGYGDPLSHGGRGIPGQGYDGGTNMFNYYSGGGGGAGQKGYSAWPPHGGDGRLSDILGVAHFWGGGGGGSGYSGDGGNGGAGGGGGGAIGATRGGLGLNNGENGLGGGRNAGPNLRGGDGGTNTGGGGGGGSHYSATNRGGNGGSGIVVVRYRI